MANNIEITKLWQDYDLMQLKVSCTTDIIAVNTKVYASNDLIDDLINQIYRFLDGTNAQSFWSNGDRGNNSTLCLSFCFSHKDNLGHERIEIFTELDDGGSYDTHNCCFFLDTENGLLEEFSKKLAQLKQPQFNSIIALNNDDF